jgi:N-methylhydantoinase A
LIKSALKSKKLIFKVHSNKNEIAEKNMIDTLIRPTVSVGVDIGGTFTDMMFLDEQNHQIKVVKVSSTPHDQSDGLLHGLDVSGVELERIGLLVHGTTVATNAVLERKGAICALITTAGFRDVLEMRRRDRPQTWGLRGTFEPLVPRQYRYEVHERTDATGNILQPLDPAELETIARRIRAEDAGIEVIIVCFIHSYANPTNERLAKEVLEKVWPDHYIVLSSEVMPEYREFERTSTSVVNGYVQPVIARYLNHLEERLRDRGYGRDVLVIQSNGGLMSIPTAGRLAVNTVLSGPAAGVIATAYIANAAGFPNAISCDMGGTSLDISLIANGKPTLTSDTKVDFGVPVRTPMIQIHTIGAGGGSIAWLDSGGFLQIGPESAGAFPGPVCYRKGGTRPTVTDANLVLGRINPRRSISGEPLDVEAARAAIGEQIGQPNGLSVEEAANAIIEVANVKMAGAIRLISIERGHDPRDFALVPFGGAGPLHAAALLKKVGIARALVPYYPGIVSAIGCIIADARYDLLRTVNRRLDDLDLEDIQHWLNESADATEKQLRAEGINITEVERLYEADMAYEGQVHAIRTPLTLEGGNLSLERIRADFEAAYRREYGRILNNIPVRLVTLRLAVIGKRPRLDLHNFIAPEARLARSVSEAAMEQRPVYFDNRFYDTIIYDRSRLPLGTTFDGPAIIEQGDTTTIVEPDMTAQVDEFGNLIISQKPGEQA